MLNSLAIDDEPLALDIIEKFTSQIEGVKLVAKCTSPYEALEVLKSNKIDLMFLDIQMADMTGIQFLRSLENPPLVIFTTAYESYALEGYDLDIIDYLLKPIPFDRFQKAVNKAKDFFELRKDKKAGSDCIFVRSEYQLVKINFDDVIYIEGLKDYVKIFAGAKPVFSHQNLKTIEGKLPSSMFLRVHKSYIVSLKKIESVHKNGLKVGGVEIPVGDSYKDQLNKIIKGI